MDESGADAEAVRKQILAAAFDELTHWGIERFSVQNLSARHHIDPAAIADNWPNEDDLLLDVLLDWPGRILGPPDTGSLVGDLTLMVMGMAAYIGSDAGREIQSALMIPNSSGLRVDVRQKVWQCRSSKMSEVFTRAIARNEMRADLDPRVILQMVMAPINMRVLLTHEPVDEPYLRTLVDLVCRAVAPTD